jgi:hypothetical protein
MHFGRSIHVAGTLVMGVDYRISVPVDCRLVRVSAVGSNANDGQLSVGTGPDTDSILELSDIGDSGIPAVYEASDWASTNPTGRLEQGDVLVVTLDHDGDGGSGAQNVTIDLEFVEG